MHVIIGGAYNGKREYVLQRLGNRRYQLCEGAVPVGTFSKEEYVIISDFAQLVLTYQHHDELEVAEIIINQLKQLQQQTTVICICQDLGRGVVPIEKEQRFIRDACGRVYQRLFKEAETVTRIWYGIPEEIKGGKTDLL